MIQYIINKIITTKIKKILLITHTSKNTIKNHFNTSYKLKSLLKQHIKHQLLTKIQSIYPPNITIINIHQNKPLNLNHSILYTQPTINNNPFIIILPNIIINNTNTNPLHYNLTTIITHFNKTNHNQILTKHIPNNLSKYSIIQTKKPLNHKNKINHIIKFIKKPNQPQTLNSNIITINHYILSTNI